MEVSDSTCLHVAIYGARTFYFGAERVGYKEIRAGAQREVDRLHADLARLQARVGELEAMREAVFGRDAVDGCCAPGKWCCFKTYSELAVDYAAALSQIARAALPDAGGACG